MVGQAYAADTRSHHWVPELWQDDQSQKARKTAAMEEALSASYRTPAKAGTQHQVGLGKRMALQQMPAQRSRPSKARVPLQTSHWGQEIHFQASRRVRGQ